MADIETVEIHTTEDYLKQMVNFRKNFLKGNPKHKDDYYYCGMEDFVLQNGKAYEYQKIPKRYSNKRKYSKFKQCFQNATKLMWDFPELTYVEGYASTVIPTLHAWCIDKNGMVVDPTWGRDPVRTEKYPPHGYFGVAFTQREVERMIVLTGFYGMLDQWAAKWPILKNKFEPGKFGILTPKGER
jgi:hypothetical protein